MSNTNKEEIQEIVSEILLEMKDTLAESIANKLTETDTFKTVLKGTQDWVCNDFASEIERWIIEIYTPVMLKKLSTKIDTNAIVKELKEYFELQESETQEPIQAVGKIYDAE